MATNEILTLQFGHYSNFVGAHWWNLQESNFKYNPDVPSDINHDVLYREGVNLKGEVTFTPRLLLADLKGSLGTLPSQGELYNIQDPNNELMSDVEVQEQPRIVKNSLLHDLEQGLYDSNKFYNLEEEVSVWSDFLYERFHPRTVNIVNEYQHLSEHSRFDVFPLGAKLWRTDAFCEDFADKIRQYIEECNHFQGFHVMLDAENAFGGLSNSCLEHLSDEYASKTIFAFPYYPGFDNFTPINFLNLALSYQGLCNYSELFVPLGTPNSDKLTFDKDLPYHTSAILATALDTATLIYRLKNSTTSLSDVCSDFQIGGRKVASQSLRLPFPITDGYLIDCLDHWEGPLVESLTPHYDINSDGALQMFSLRGVEQSKLKSLKHRELPAYQCESPKKMLEFYLNCTCFGSKNSVSTTDAPLTISNTFPRILNPPQSSIPVLAGFNSGSFIGEGLEILNNKLEKVKYKKVFQFSDEGVESDQLSECFEDLLSLRDCYKDNYLI